MVVTFFFPAYKRAKRDISYVSGIQITPALYEGLFVAAGNYVKNETDKIIEFNYRDFPEKCGRLFLENLINKCFLKNRERNIRRIYF